MISQILKEQSLSEEKLKFEGSKSEKEMTPWSRCSIALIQKNYKKEEEKKTKKLEVQGKTDHDQFQTALTVIYMATLRVKMFMS